MKQLYRDARGNRPGAYDFSVGEKLLAVTTAAWIIVLAAAWVIHLVAGAAAGLI